MKKLLQALSYIFGIMFALGGLMGMFVDPKSRGMALGLCLFGVSLLPITWSLIQSKWVILNKVAKPLKVLLPIAFFIMAIALTPPSTKKTAPVTTEKATQPTEQATNNPPTEPVVNKEVSVPTPQPEAPKNQPVVTPPAPAPVVKQEPAPQPQPKPTILDQLWTASDKVVGSRKGIDIKYDETKKLATLTYYTDSFYSEQSYVEDFYRYFVNYGKAVFNLEGVDQLKVTFLTDFIDGYGNSSVEDAITMTMDKTAFQKFNWAGMEWREIPAINNLITTEASDYFMKFPLQKALSGAKIILSF